MTNGSVLIFPPGPDIVGQAIKDVTHGPAHIAICVGGFVFDDTVWHQPGRFLPVSGVRLTPMSGAAALGIFTVRDPVTPWLGGEMQSALDVAVAQVNLRRRYNVLLLLSDAILYPLWKLGMKWDPFKNAKEYVCSSFAGLVYRASGRDPWPGKDTEELVPEDFVLSKEWKDA